MSQDDSNTKKVTLEYIKSVNYFEAFATGFWGGLNPAGKIQISFYEDQLDMPEKSEITISEEEITKKEKTIKKEKDIIRVIKGTITFDIDKLDSFLMWINDRKKFLEEQKNKV